ncbi:MAG: hypothetical protein KAQ89_05835, partial [Planctomycetes bacterium]|nr:hypothetical protein [Planctomycetota bacterium]
PYPWLFHRAFSLCYFRPNIQIYPYTPNYTLFCILIGVLWAERLIIIALWNPYLPRKRYKKTLFGGPNILNPIIRVNYGRFAFICNIKII